MYCGISCNLDRNILETALPLFEEGIVEAIEWSFDALFQHEYIPDWFEQLLQVYAQEGRLIGHGVYYSLFSGKWTPQQQQWLNGLQATTNQYPLDHVSEHFGYMTGEDFHKGAPLSVPYNKTTLSIATDRMKRMHNACQTPVGLENLAFSYCIDEVKQHGNFINQILAPVNGFLILDLHNVYCQTHNFDVPFQELINCYPLERVREIHISGGSWEESTIEQGRTIRRDTHDDAVPKIVFEYLKTVIPQVPNLKFVMLEQLGSDLKTPESRQQFRKDFQKMISIVSRIKLGKSPSINDFMPKNFALLEQATESKQLAEEQQTLNQILENAESFEVAKKSIHQSMLKDSDWNIEQWEDGMLETAYLIARKWKEGFKTKNN